MATLTSCSILHVLGHFCDNIHLRHPFFCDMNQQYWITISRRFEVAYGFTFKVRNVPSLDNSWTFLPLKMIHCVVSRRREWMHQPHWYKSLKIRITPIYFHFLCFVQTWVTSARTWSEWHGLSRPLQHPPTQPRPYSEVFTWIKLRLDSSGTAKLNHESCRSL